jgi:hypothetical protein
VDASVSEIEVRFEEAGAAKTNVEVEHRHFELRVKRGAKG